MVEVDGEIHARQTEYDDARTAKLAEYSCKVLRFRNEQVRNDLPQVLAGFCALLFRPPSPQGCFIIN